MQEQNGSGSYNAVLLERNPGEGGGTCTPAIRAPGERTGWTRDVGASYRGPSGPGALKRLAGGALPLDEAFLTLARYGEEQARSAADVQARECWAVTAVLARSVPLWERLARPTLRFATSQGEETAPSWLEVGRFAHLGALVAPTAEERTLIAAPAPCWARVAAHTERVDAGCVGALACSYTPVSIAEAVAVLGCRRILTQIEGAARAAGAALLAATEEQAERQAYLLTVERMLRVVPDPTTDGVTRATPPQQMLLLLLGRGRWVLLALSMWCLVVAALVCGTLLILS